MRRWLYLLALLVGVLGFSYLRCSGRPRQADPLAPSAEASDQAANAVLAGTGDSVPRSDEDRGIASESADPALDVESNGWLEVRSSARLPLASIEIEVEERLWQRRKLEEHRCRIDDVPLPARVRAPGHLDALAVRLGETVELEPDALFVIEGDDLRRCLRSIEPLASWTRKDSPYRDEHLASIAESLTFGFADERRWMIAATSRELSNLFLGEMEVDICLEWRDRRKAYVEFVVASGRRGTWEAPCEGLGLVAPLEVVLVRSENTLAGELEVSLSRSGASRGDAEVTIEPWGRVVAYPKDHGGVIERLPPSDRIHVEDIRLGVPWYLSVRDLGSGAVGVTSFVHDGSTQELALADSITIRGRLSVPAGHVLPPRAWFHWEEADPSGKVWHRSNWREPELAPDGSFELRGWENRPYIHEPLPPPPAAIVLTGRAPGFETFVRTLEVDSLGGCDIDEIVLSPVATHLHFLPGHELEGKIRSQECTLSIASVPSWRWELASGRQAPDGSLDLALETDGVDPEGRPKVYSWQPSEAERSLRPFPPAPFDALLISHLGNRGLAFVRTQAGFARVPERTWEVEVDCRALPAPDRSWVLHWRWRGMTEWFGSLGRESVGERRVFQFVAPETEIEIEWLSCERRNSASTSRDFGAGSIALDRPRLSLALP